jgi:signal transduction histidine kinase
MIAPVMAWRWPKLELRAALWLLGAFSLLGLWSGSTALLTVRGDGSELPWSRPMLWELSGALAAYVALPIALTTAANAPRGRWVRFALVHLAGFALFSAVKLTLMLGSRFLLYAALDWGAYEYGPFALRIPMEVQKDVVGYLGFLAGLELWRLWRERQAVELNLRQAQLRALTGQLGPHFLFNSLNTISAVMYEDLGRTDRLLADLGILLRASFEAGAPSWPLAEERAYAERYLRIMEARLGDRVVVTWQLEAEAAGAQVPRFALQLLVENALKHNADRPEPLHLAIRARLRQGPRPRLELTVEDDGRGFPPELLAAGVVAADGAPVEAAPGDPGAAREASGGGTGLRQLAHGAALLFGGEAELALSAREAGGARVTLSVPVRR